MNLESPTGILVASKIGEVRSILRQAVAAADRGSVVAGFVTYEAAPAFDPVMQVRQESCPPLVWFGVFDRAEILDRLPAPLKHPEPTIWKPSWTATEYEKSIRSIHQHIARGDTYQVNLTLRLEAELQGDPWHLFRSLCHGQRSDCCAYVDTGDLVLCSASPELFFSLENDRIRCRPMKGTAARGRTLEEDLEQAQWLRDSAKNRAENVMIVDMVRNDLGRIADPATVRVVRLWDLEKYPSVYQLTSTIEAQTESSVEEIFTALFPCASITGAPKIRAMEIIRYLETEPRGVYTGAIGFIGPGRRARFNVAIRTVQIDPRARRATYGTGGGIVWDSVAAEEWQECRTKALVLKSPPPEFQLLETLRWDPDEGFFLLDRHLARLQASAEYFDYPFDLQTAAQQLAEYAECLSRQPLRARLLLDSRGELQIETDPLNHEPGPWRLALAIEPIDTTDPFLFHKTTHRQAYRHHQDRFPHHQDVLLWNERREITESTLANVVVRFAERLLTPPLESGLLAGTFRAELLERGEIVPAVIHLEDLRSADEILLINSVREWIPTQFDVDAVAAAAET